MKFKIDENGMLSLWKRDKWVEQYCPHGYEEGRCGDWCPLFRVEEQHRTGSKWGYKVTKGGLHKAGAVLVIDTVLNLHLCRVSYKMLKEVDEDDSGDRSEDTEQGRV